MARLTFATCQFPVAADSTRNGRYVVRQVREARARGARVVHFPEAALPGYAGVDLETLDDLDWDLLEKVTRGMMTLAAELGVWVLLGSTHPLSAGHKPHNSLYVIDDRGDVVDRYGKRFCAFVVRADGVTTGRLPQHQAGVLVTTIDTDEPLYDSTAPWRGRAMDGVLHTGSLVQDPRSRARTEL